MKSIVFALLVVSSSAHAALMFTVEETSVGFKMRVEDENGALFENFSMHDYVQPESQSVSWTLDAYGADSILIEHTATYAYDSRFSGDQVPLTFNTVDYVTGFYASYSCETLDTNADGIMYALPCDEETLLGIENVDPHLPILEGIYAVDVLGVGIKLQRASDFDDPSWIQPEVASRGAGDNAINIGMMIDALPDGELFSLTYRHVFAFGASTVPAGFASDVPGPGTLGLLIPALGALLWRKRLQSLRARRCLGRSSDW